VAALILIPLLAASGCASSQSRALDPGQPEAPLAPKQGGWMPIVVRVTADDRYHTEGENLAKTGLFTQQYTFPLKLILERTLSAETGETFRRPLDPKADRLVLNVRVSMARLTTPSAGNMSRFDLALDVDCRDSAETVLDSFTFRTNRTSSFDGHKTPTAVWSACLEATREILAKVKKSQPVLISARRLAERSPTSSNGPAPVPAAAVGGPLLLPCASKWGEGVESGSVGRFAVIITADEYASDPGWNLPSCRKSGEVMVAALSRNARVPKKKIRWLKGRDVNRDAIKAAIHRVGNEVRKGRNLLVVFFAGHGWVDAEGQPCFFTHYTSEIPGGGYEQVVGRNDLVAWTDDLRRRARSAGGELETVLVVDACRVGAAAPPPAARLVTSDIWEIYGTKEGRYARVGKDETEPLPFTRSLVESMRSLGERRERADLARLFDVTRTRTRQLTANLQDPQLKRAGKGAAPVLVMPFSITFTLSLADALNRVGITERATVRFDDVEHPVEGGRVTLSTSPGAHRLEVEAEGHLTRSEVLTIKEDRQGASVEVPLYPSAVLVRGRVAPAKEVRVSVSGLEEVTREGFHRTGADTDPLGGFELLLPALEEGMELVVTSGGQTIHRVPLPTKTTAVKKVDTFLVPTLELQVSLPSR
jgi:hypothetical protein